MGGKKSDAYLNPDFARLGRSSKDLEYLGIEIPSEEDTPPVLHLVDYHRESRSRNQPTERVDSESHDADSCDRTAEMDIHATIDAINGLSPRPQRCLEGEVRRIQGGLTQSREGAKDSLTSATYGPKFV